MIHKILIIKARTWQPMVALFKSNLTAVCDKHVRVFYKIQYYVTNSSKHRKQQTMSFK